MEKNKIHLHRFHTPLAALYHAGMHVLTALLFSCTTPDTAPRQGRPEHTSPSTETDTAPGVDTGLDTGRCPAGMVAIDDAFCIDQHEASLEAWSGGQWAAASPYETVDGRRVRAVTQEGQVPQAYISGEEAAAACAESGKRLCSSTEWLRACQGPNGWTYPYGDSHIPGACNDDYNGGHPVVDYFGTSDGVWDSTHMNEPGINQQPGTVAAAGEYTGCVTEAGVADLHGNLHEWVSDASGTFRGGFYADAAINGVGCGYVTTAHSMTYHDYSTGFRCCSALQ